MSGFVAVVAVVVVVVVVLFCFVFLRPLFACASIETYPAFVFV